jgi:putative ABC transport system ATP-binding protein
MIEIVSVTRTFTEGKRSLKVLREVNLDVHQGECVIIQGISGSGKSTLLHLIAGLDKPDSGKILVEDEPVSKLSDARLSAFRGGHVGMVFQHFYLIEHLSVAYNVAVPLIATQMESRRQKQRVEEVMALANISHKASSRAADLSGGEKQRVAIARALVADPEVILCDEPTANLDRDNTQSFIEVLQSLHDMGKTVLVATHDPRFESLPFPARIVHMSEGKIIE